MVDTFDTGTSTGDSSESRITPMTGVTRTVTEVSDPVGGVDVEYVEFEYAWSPEQLAERLLSLGNISAVDINLVKTNQEKTRMSDVYKRGIDMEKDVVGRMMEGFENAQKKGEWRSISASTAHAVLTRHEFQYLGGFVTCPKGWTGPVRGTNVFGMSEEWELNAAVRISVDKIDCETVEALAQSWGESGWRVVSLCRPPPGGVLFVNKEYEAEAKTICATKDVKWTQKGDDMVVMLSEFEEMKLFEKTKVVRGKVKKSAAKYLLMRKEAIDEVREAHKARGTEMTTWKLMNPLKIWEKRATTAETEDKVAAWISSMLKKEDVKVALIETATETRMYTTMTESEEEKLLQNPNGVSKEMLSIVVLNRRMIFKRLTRRRMPRWGTVVHRGVVPTAFAPSANAAQESTEQCGEDLGAGVNSGADMEEHTQHEARQMNQTRPTWSEVVAPQRAGVDTQKQELELEKWKANIEAQMNNMFQMMQMMQKSMIQSEERYMKMQGELISRLEDAVQEMRVQRAVETKAEPRFSDEIPPELNASMIEGVEDSEEEGICETTTGAMKRNLKEADLHDSMEHVRRPGWKRPARKSDGGSWSSI